MTHASLFSGIGGAEIAATWMGWENIFHCEINPFGRKVLEYWYPNSVSYEDIKQTDFTPWRGRIDVLTAGFPCQPFSLAGSRKGADDDRYLWPQVVRVIRETRPAWFVGENVAGILTMVQPGEEVEVGGGASLFGEDYRKRVLLRQQFTVDAICQDLEREGYEVQPFVIPACAVGAPHRRDRVWIVARRTAPDPTRHGDSRRPGQIRKEKWRPETGLYAEPFEHGCIQGGLASHPDEHRSPSRAAGEGTERSRQDKLPLAGERRVGSQRPDGLHGLPRDAAHTDSNEFQRECFSRKAKAERWKDENRRFEEYSGNDWATLPADRWRNFPTQSPVCSRDDGFPIPMDGITFSKWRQEAIKAYGNAWCAPVAYEIFRAIQKVTDEENNGTDR